jgi:hypothetical protein
MKRDYEDQEIRTQIERCRRIASQMTDDEIRQSLEQLAEEYESRMGRPPGLMVRDSGGSAAEQPGSGRAASRGHRSA